MNPKVYCAENGLTTAEFIAKAQEVAPKYNKVAHCLASNTDYGVGILPKVAAHVRGKAENRTKPCKFTYRLLESDSDEFNAARRHFGHNVQQATEYAIQLYIEKAASEAGTSRDGKAFETITNDITKAGELQDAKYT